MFNDLQNVCGILPIDLYDLQVCMVYYQEVYFYKFTMSNGVYSVKGVDGKHQ